MTACIIFLKHFSSRSNLPSSTNANSCSVHTHCMPIGLHSEFRLELTVRRLVSHNLRKLHSISSLHYCWFDALIKSRRCSAVKHWRNFMRTPTIAENERSTAVPGGKREIRNWIAKANDCVTYTLARVHQLLGWPTVAKSRLEFKTVINCNSQEKIFKVQQPASREGLPFHGQIRTPIWWKVAVLISTRTHQEMR